MATRHDIPAAPAAKPPSDIVRLAQQRLAAQLAGNGIGSGELRISLQETDEHAVQGRLAIRLRTSWAERRLKPGEEAQGQNVANRDGAEAALAAMAGDLYANAEIAQAVADAVAKQPAQGFAAPDEINVPLGLQGPVFHYSAPCAACSGHKAVACKTCRGDGNVNCPQCQTQGHIRCTACYGSGVFQTSDGTGKTCATCKGQGNLSCTRCSGGKVLSCGDCRGQGMKSCAICAASGREIVILSSSLSAVCRFEISGELPPAFAAGPPEELQEIAQAGEADIEAGAVETRAEEFSIPLTLRLPVAEVQFSVQGKRYGARIVGRQARVSVDSPMLDPLIKPGIAALFRMTKGGVGSDALLQSACRFRVVREVLSGLARQSKSAVYKKINDDYPDVLSDKYARALIKYASDALAAALHRPRRQGLAIGICVTAMLAAGYFLSPARGMLAAFLQQHGLEQHIVAGDIAVWLAGWLLTLLKIRRLTAKRMRLFVPQETDEHVESPSAGMEGMLALPLSLLPWGLAAALAADKPQWMLQLLQKAGF